MTPAAKIGKRKALTFSSQTRTPPTASGIAHAVTTAYQSWIGPPNCACAATANTDPSNTANHVPVRASASVAIAATPGGTAVSTESQRTRLSRLANTIVANAKTPPDVVYQFTKVLLSDLGGVRKIHPAFKDFDPKEAVKLGNVPLHPGAEKAYKEAGLLK